MATRSWSFAILIVTISFFVSILAGNAVRVPFPSQHFPKPIAKHHNITDIESVSAGYAFVLNLYPFVGQTWHGECFQDNYGYVTYTGDAALGYVVINPSNSKSAWCTDYYEFKVGDQTIGTDSIFSALYPHKTAFDSSDSELRKYIKEHGVAVYMWTNGLNVDRNRKEEAFEERPQPSRVADVIDVAQARSEDKSYSAA